MNNRLLIRYLFFCVLSAMLIESCIPALTRKKVNPYTPSTYPNSTTTDTTNSAKVQWKAFFDDSILVALIDTALVKNQDLQLIRQDIQIAKNEIRARKGLYLPFLNLFGTGIGDKSARYTRNGAFDANNEIVPGQAIPGLLPDYAVGVAAFWQLDIWKQLRNAKKAAVFRYMASNEGKNFMVTNLIAQIAMSYYELMALDNQLEIVQNNIEIQKNALNVITLEKAAGQVTELAVLRFQAEVRKNQSRQYFLEQKIVEAQNNIRYLTGTYLPTINRNAAKFLQITTDSVPTGIPTQLLSNRPDIRQAEMELTASNLDIKAAKANFYPSVIISGALGFQAFNPVYLFLAPQSLLYNAAGALAAPLINRNAIKATYATANAKQLKAAYNYERLVLRAFTEVMNQQASIRNLASSFEYKEQQVDALSRSVNISINLFKSARADYVEVLLTQRDVIEAKMELIETKKQQLYARVKMYQVLGGGWR